MSILCIRLPSKSIADVTPNWVDLSCPFAQIAQSGAIESDGISAISSLSDVIAKVQRIVLLVSASDVTMLRVKTPPLSASRLKAALPNLVEEHLLCDPAECAIVTGNEVDGLRTVAVMQREWLEKLSNTLIAYGARQITAVPAQTCLNLNKGPQDATTAAAYVWNDRIDLTVRLSEYQGIGLTLAADDNDRPGSEPAVSTARSVVQTLASLVHRSPITLYVAQNSIRAYEDALSALPELSQRITISTDNWTRWVGGALNSPLNLLAGITQAHAPKTNWLPWRWSLIFASALLLINAGAVNFDWWRMRSEEKSLRIAMVDIYRSAYPKETVIIDPIAQLRQKITLAQTRSGVAGADDFSSIIGIFGEAWSRVSSSARSPHAIAAIEFHDHALLVRVKSAKDQLNDRGEDTLVQQLTSALAKHDASLEVIPDQTGQVVWKIRSTK
ncbi:MAG: type II secretion system protein GspL [Gallionella sp.]